MRTLLLTLLLTMGWATQSLAQNENWGRATAWFDQETAEKAKDILKEKGKVMFNEGCATGWGAITISYIKKVKVKESNTGEGNYDIFIKIEMADDSIIESKIFLDTVKVEDENGEWVYLAELLGVEGDYCRANEK
ncbi:hypothetical protein [Parvicella tangerina]|uniref:Uncharacterized protein n=1 Tax=Parvicella tangerina TaxID=2829795 RepID=A0A916NAX8_9FLAO|nr:hypothetical protein [Parvicella tangerina]CAG5081677.1 hypothetical protein CRYO30217_01700 [Parvicella tangerina]